MRRPGPQLRWFILLAALAAGPATGPSDRGALRTFTSPEYGFRLTYPAGWIAPEHPVNGQLFSVRTPELPPSTQPSTRATSRPAAERFATVGLRIDAGPDGAPDHSILKDVSGTLIGYVMNHGASHVVLRPDKLGDVPARRVRFQLGDPTAGATTVMYVLAVHKRVEYVLSIAAPADGFDALLPDVDAMVKSFELLE